MRRILPIFLFVVMVLALPSCKRGETEELPEPVPTLTFFVKDALGTGLRGSLFVPAFLLRDYDVLRTCGVNVDSLMAYDNDGDGLPSVPISLSFSCDTVVELTFRDLRPLRIKVALDPQGLILVDENDSVFGQGKVILRDLLYVVEVADTFWGNWGDSSLVIATGDSAGWYLGRLEGDSLNGTLPISVRNLSFTLFLLGNTTLKEVELTTDSLSVATSPYGLSPVPYIGNLNFYLSGTFSYIRRGDHRGDGGYEARDVKVTMYPVDRLFTGITGRPDSGSIYYGVLAGEYITDIDIEE